MTVRVIEVDLTKVEDDILRDLGYRETQVQVGTDTIDPPPEVTEIPMGKISVERMHGYVNRLGGNGNPTNIFQVTISRLVDEAIIRQQAYWTLTRDTWIATCLPVELHVDDSRYNLTLAVIKIAS